MVDTRSLPPISPRPVSLPQVPLPPRAAALAVAHCVGRSTRLLASRRVHLRHDLLGLRLRFADDTRARVYRDTVADGAAREPCLLVVGFRLRAVHGRGHAAFRAESLLNTPLFVGFPGFVSKLWMTHDERERYRGVYEWDAADRAEAYARALWQVLAAVSAPGSIGYRVVPGLRRADLLTDPACVPGDGPEWWRPVGTG